MAGALVAWAVSNRKEVTVIAPVDPEMVVIKGGDYVIGSDRGPANARPAHRVPIETFGIDVHEVTVGDYADFVAERGVPAPWGEARPDSLLPVTGVQHAEAMNFCAWKHSPSGRLPTEAEWEAAARGLTSRPLPWGETWGSGPANTESARRKGPVPVGSYPGGRTPEGVHDLVGNVWEWTNTPMAAYPGGESIPNVSQYYVIRGGAFNTPDSAASSVLRGYASPTADRATLDKTGFRCVMPIRQSGGS